MTPHTPDIKPCPTCGYNPDWHRNRVCRFPCCVVCHGTGTVEPRPAPEPNAVAEVHIQNMMREFGWSRERALLASGAVELAPDSGDDLTKILKSLAEAAHADGWGGINSYSLDMVAEVHAAIEALYAARFERAMEKQEVYLRHQDIPNMDEIMAIRQKVRDEARAVWYTPEPKGEQHG